MAKAVRAWTDKEGFYHNTKAAAVESDTTAALEKFFEDNLTEEERKRGTWNYTQLIVNKPNVFLKLLKRHARYVARRRKRK